MRQYNSLRRSHGPQLLQEASTPERSENLGTYLRTTGPTQLLAEPRGKAILRALRTHAEAVESHPVGMGSASGALSARPTFAVGLGARAWNDQGRRVQASRPVGEKGPGKKRGRHVRPAV